MKSKAENPDLFFISILAVYALGILAILLL